MWSWLAVVAVILGAAAVLADEAHGFAVTAPAHLAVLPMWLALIGAGVWLILLFDPFRSMRRHWPVLLAAAALGATAANAAAVYGNGPAGRWAAAALGCSPEAAFRLQSAVVAPVVEETAKGLCALLLMLSARQLNRVTHALMIGMFTGFGFQIAENLNLATISAIWDPYSFEHGIAQSMRYRLPSLISSHWCYTGMTAVAAIILLPWFAERRAWSQRRRLLTASGLVLAALGMHGLWNLPPPAGIGPTLADAVKLAVNTAVLLTVTLLLLRVERHHVLTVLADERDRALGAFRPAVLDSLPTCRQRCALRFAALRRNGIPGFDDVHAAQRRALDAVQSLIPHMSSPMSSTRTE